MSEGLIDYLKRELSEGRSEQGYDLFLTHSDMEEVIYALEFTDNTIA